MEPPSRNLNPSSPAPSACPCAANQARTVFRPAAESTANASEEEQCEEHADKRNTGKRKTLVLPLCLDMHTHLRQGGLMRLVTPMVKRGGCGVALVMPNTTPPIVTCAQAKAYWEQLQQLDSSVEYLMTLYLCEQVTAEDLRQNGRACHVTGVKCYPKGVTTNSEGGVENFDPYNGLFEAMQELGLVLHLHGEVPGASPLDAERLFLPVFEQLHARFPRLQIVLEHVSTAAAVRAVQSKPKDVVAATITPHHLMLTVDDVLRPDFINSEKCGHAEAVAQPHKFCKPLAKTREDREALREVVRQGDPHFFLGSDSAPHLMEKKESVPPAAGVFTQPLLLAYLAKIFEELGCLHKLRSFAVDNATSFFRLKQRSLVAGFDCVVLDPTPEQVPLLYALDDAREGVVPFMAGRTLPYCVQILPYKHCDLKDSVEL